MRETRVRSLGWEDPLEKEMATHSSILPCKIPWTEEPGRLRSMGSQRVWQDWATSLHFTSRDGLVRLSLTGLGENQRKNPVVKHFNFVRFQYTATKTKTTLWDKQTPGDKETVTGLAKKQALWSLLCTLALHLILLKWKEWQEQW